MRRFRTGRSGLPTAGSRFEPQRVALEDTHGHVLEELLQPRSSFKGHSLETPWNDLQLAYFAGCAMWTYLNTPFLLVRPGVESEEVAPWQEAGETWRRLKVRFTSDIKAGLVEFAALVSNNLKRISFENKQKLLRIVLEKIVVKDWRVDGYYNIP